MPRSAFSRLRSRQDDGAAAVEFALVLPVLLVVVFGIITFGIMLSQELALGNAARQAARFGAVAGHTCGDITAEAQNNAAAPGMVPGDITISITRDGGFSCGGDPTVKPCAGSDPDQSVHVVASFTSAPIVPMVLDNSIDLTGEGRFRCEFS